MFFLQILHSKVKSKSSQGRGTIITVVPYDFSSFKLSLKSEFFKTKFLCFSLINIFNLKLFINGLLSHLLFS